MEIALTTVLQSIGPLMHPIHEPMASASLTIAAAATGRDGHMDKAVADTMLRYVQAVTEELIRRVHRGTALDQADAGRAVYLLAAAVMAADDDGLQRNTLIGDLLARGRE